MPARPSLVVWHATPDAPRRPVRPVPGEDIVLEIGTRPIEPGQTVRVEIERGSSGTEAEPELVTAVWTRNEGGSSYWAAHVGPFRRGESVRYRIAARSPRDAAETGPYRFKVGPAVRLALLWHQHQPMYRDLGAPSPRGAYRQPWVRLHGIRDYYSMAALVEDHPGVQVTLNLTPSLVRQLDEYGAGEASDRALELTTTPAERMSGDDREELLADFFDAHWQNQIFPNPRYRDLFLRRQEGRAFSTHDLRDLQMWFNPAWFPPELRRGSVTLPDGEAVSVREWVERESGFSVSDLEEVVGIQRRVLGAVVPLHRRLQAGGRVELTTSPYYHPILPLLQDTDAATLDRPGSVHPPRFSRPDDAEAQLRRALEAHAHWFGRPPAGVWPPEGAVSDGTALLLARHGVRWTASDGRVLARSGPDGHDVEDPDVLCRPYRFERDGEGLWILFRDGRLADRIGFHYHGWADYGEAARHFLDELRDRFGTDAPEGGRLVTVALDGENAWSAYRDDTRPFLHALYGLLEEDGTVETVTPSRALDGAGGEAGEPASRGGAPARLERLFVGSWADENGSDPGVDLGTWIGEEEENRAWELLAATREAVDAAGLGPEQAPEAYESLYAAEGSDWFWWFGTDHDAGNDEEFDDLFRLHLRNVHAALGRPPPPELDDHIVPHAVVWRFTDPVPRIQAEDRLTVRTNCPGVLSWRLDGGEERTMELTSAGGAMAGIRRFHTVMGPFPPDVRRLRFVFHCSDPACDGTDPCCSRGEQTVEIT